MGITVEFIPGNKVMARVPSLFDHNTPSSSITDADDVLLLILGGEAALENTDAGAYGGGIMLLL